MSEPTLWGIHAGKTGDAHTIFKTGNVVALGWTRIGDLASLPPEREAFKAHYSDAYPNAKPRAVGVSAGQLYRFVHEVSIGDLIVYPSKSDRRLHIARITGPYRYSSKHKNSYPHQRSVEWLDSFPRTQFSQGALYEIGSAMSLFQVRNYADEIHSALAGDPVSPPVKEDETVGIVTEDFEQATRDFVLKTLSQELKGHPLADFVGHLLTRMRYHVRVSPPGPDKGIDIIAHRDELGFEPPIVKVQVKSGDGKVGSPEVQALYGNVEPNEHGLLVTLGEFSAPARNFADSKSNLRLIDGEGLVDLILAYYESFDSRYKGLLPLKRIYVPEPLIDSSE